MVGYTPVCGMRSRSDDNIGGMAKEVRSDGRFVPLCKTTPHCLRYSIAEIVSVSLLPSLSSSITLCGCTTHGLLWQQRLYYPYKENYIVKTRGQVYLMISPFYQAF